MKLINSLFFFIIFPCTLLAHEGNEAFFKIEQTKDSLILSAEFPWTIRNSLFLFDPALKNSNSKEEFDNSFFNYLKSNIIVTDSDGNNLKLIRVATIKNNGHSHQNDFNLTFLGDNFKRIHNSVLFNLNPDQVNYHIINSGAGKTTYKTSPENPDFIYNPTISLFSSRNIIGLIVLLGVVLILFYKKRQKNNL